MMAQNRTPPETWIFYRESIKLYPFVIEVGGVATTAYTLCCLPDDGSEPVTFTAPTIIGGRSGYLVNGPLLGGLPGTFRVFYKIISGPESVIDIAGLFRLV